MHSAMLDMPTESSMGTPFEEASRKNETIETRLWIEEHDWLYSLMKSCDNVSPTFRFPDLISACVSLVFCLADGAERIFNYLGTELILRDLHTTRRQESMWKAQYNLLLALQRSPALHRTVWR